MQLQPFRPSLSQQVSEVCKADELSFQITNKNFLLEVSKSRKKYDVLDSSKKRTLGHLYVLKNAPAFVFWKNPGRHNLLSGLSDL